MKKCIYANGSYAIFQYVKHGFDIFEVYFGFDRTTTCWSEQRARGLINTEILKCADY